MTDKIKFIKLNIDRLIIEPSPTACLRFSHPIFTRKMPKGCQLSDYSPTERMVELEYDHSGDRFWFPIEVFFGKVAQEVEDFIVVRPEYEETMHIVGIDKVKVKRTWYWKLIFQEDLPF